MRKLLSGNLLSSRGPIQRDHNPAFSARRRRRSDRIILVVAAVSLNLGPFETCQQTRGMSVVWGRPEANAQTDANAHSRPPVRFPKQKARQTSAIECQIRGHGCGVVVLKAIEHQITAEQDDCQQAIHKIRRQSGPVTAHFAGSLFWRTDRSALCLGEPTQLFAAVLESSASTPAAHALANE